MQSLVQFARYNAWANRRVFEIYQAAAPAARAGVAPGAFGPLDDTLKHLVQVEDAYLLLLQGRELPRSPELREQYLAQDIDWFARRSEELAEGYRDLLAAHDGAWLGSPLRVPWFDFTMTARDGLLQVYTHSTQHRAQVLSVLGERGVSVPDIDYVGMLDEARERPGG